jgi:hypothetical protein
MPQWIIPPSLRRGKCPWSQGTDQVAHAGPRWPTLRPVRKSERKHQGQDPGDTGGQLPVWVGRYGRDTIGYVSVGSVPTETGILFRVLAI